MNQNQLDLTKLYCIGDLTGLDLTDQITPDINQLAVFYLDCQMVKANIDRSARTRLDLTILDWTKPYWTRTRQDLTGSSKINWQLINARSDPTRQIVPIWNQPD